MLTTVVGAEGGICVSERKLTFLGYYCKYRGNVGGTPFCSFHLPPLFPQIYCLVQCCPTHLQWAAPAVAKTHCRAGVGTEFWHPLVVSAQYWCLVCPALETLLLMSLGWIWKHCNKKGTPDLTFWGIPLLIPGSIWERFLPITRKNIYLECFAVLI